MGLKDRLDALRRQSGAGQNRTADAAELRARLQRLGGRAASARPSSRPTRETPAQLAERVGGQLLDEQLILVERRMPLESVHGRWPLAVARENAEPLVALPERVAYLDTETTGLSGGTGTLAFMVGMAELDGEAVRLRQWLITAFSGEAGMLAEVRRALAEIEMIVSYNGKSFDMPLLRDRLRLQRASLPEPEHFDLLHSVRRLFVRSWSDCRLATVEKELLGLLREDDLPGAEAPQAWKDFLAGDPSHRLHRVLSHNLLDLLSMLVLPPALARTMRSPLTYGAEPGCVASAWARAGRADAALEILLRCRDSLDHRGQLLLAAQLKRVARWREAAELWERLAELGCEQSAEHLAKYHEHVRRDWQQALVYARRLPQTPSARQRLQRLERRIDSASRGTGLGEFFAEEGRKPASTSGM